MKKTIIFAATFLMLCSVKAQTAHFGIKGGMNASSLNSGSGNSNLETKIGFNAGLLAHIHTAHAQWALQPEIYYSSEGAKGKNTNVKYNLDYLNIPLLAQYMFDNGFRIEAGPQIGFLLNAKTKTGSHSLDKKDDYTTASFSIPVGLGYLTSNGLGFDARYNFGISDIAKNNSGPALHTNVFQFGIFYQFSDSKIKK